VLINGEPMRNPRSGTDRTPAGRAPRATIVGVTAVELVPSDELDAHTRTALHALWQDAFGDRFTADDERHAFGGVHALVREDDGTLVAHAAAVPRTLLAGDRPLRTAYVEAVAVRGPRRRGGLGSLAMRSLEPVIRTGFELGGLSSASGAFYTRLGWERWRGPSSVLRSGAPVRTPDDDRYLHVLRFGPSADLDLTLPLTCDDRPGHVW